MARGRLGHPGWSEVIKSQKFFLNFFNLFAAADSDFDKNGKNTHISRVITIIVITHNAFV